MNPLLKTAEHYAQGLIDKPDFIRSMYEDHHASLFDYAEYLARTNIKKIEIEDGRIIMTSRDRGIRIACGAGDHRIAPIETLNFKDYEKAESLMMENLVEDGDNFFDIGANIGWYSVNVAATRRNAQVYSFEPLPKTYKQLATNVELNSVPNVRLHDFGFSNQVGSFPFYYYAQGSGNASSVNLTDRPDVEVVQCNVQTLDGYTATEGIRVDFIKCDVEGAELLVFQGGLQTIAHDKPMVFSEILRKWSAKFNYDPNEIFVLFRQLGYKAFTAENGGLLEFANMTTDTVQTNFFFLHIEKHWRQIARYQVHSNA
jgi:FkbM family methyltransferase